MKQLALLFVAGIFALTMVSCGGSSKSEGAADSVSVDTVAVDSAAVDTAAAK